MFNPVFGKKTGIVDSEGKNVYQYDRVYVMRNGKKLSASVLITKEDPAEHKLLIDKEWWQFDGKPEWVPLTDGNCTIIKDDEPFRFIHSSNREYLNYCSQYDYHSNTK